MCGVAHDLNLGGICIDRERQRCPERMLSDCDDSIPMSGARGPKTIMRLPSRHRHWCPASCMADKGCGHTQRQAGPDASQM